MKFLFGAILDAIRFIREGMRVQMQFLLNNLYLLIAPVLAGVRVLWSMINEVIDRVYDGLSQIEVEWISVTEGEVGSVMDILEVVNYMVPLEELIFCGVGITALWGVALLIRTIKGIKQTVAF